MEILSHLLLLLDDGHCPLYILHDDQYFEQLLNQQLIRFYYTVAKDQRNQKNMALVKLYNYL